MRAGLSEGRARRPPSLSTWIAGACLLALLPMLAFSALMLYRDLAEQQRQGLEALGRSATRAAAAVGHELDAVLAELTVLSVAIEAQNGDLQAIYELASRVVESDSRLDSISLSSPSGRQPFITSRPFGSDLPDTNASAILKPVFDGAGSIVSPLFIGSVSQRPMVSVARVVDLGPLGAHALRAAVRLEAIGARLNDHGWQADWTVAVLDQNGIIVARSRDAERFVGQPSTPGLLQSVRDGKGTFRAVTKDGVATVAAGARVPGAGWFVVVGLPAATLDAMVRDSMVLILAAGAFCVALGLAAAAYVARSVGSQLHRVVDEHIRGEPATATGVHVEEVRKIAGALASARAVVKKSFAEVEAARESALDQLKERGEMLDVLAHEVRQPLNNASAALQEANAVLLGGVSPSVGAPLSRATVVISEVLGSIDNTLAVAALLVGDKQIRRVEFDIDALVGVAIADLAPKQAMRVRVERLTGTRTASVEPNLMRLALRNLLSNALKFSPPDTMVTVRISDSDAPLAVLLDVIDNGPGIDAALLPRLFDRGDRKGHNLGGRRQGLGLYIVRRVMQMHGGAVTLERNDPSGTTMRLTVVQSLNE